MDTKEKFKEFVKDHPKLLKYTKSGEMSWQKFYEMYDLYGEDDKVWTDYLKEEEPKPVENSTPQNTASIGDMMSFVKNIDLDSVQSGVASLQRVLGVLQDFGSSPSKTPKEEYKPRPLYKHFED